VRAVTVEPTVDLAAVPSGLAAAGGDVEMRPSWRGRMHTWWFALAIPAGALLVLSAERASARVGASIYAATLLLVFGTSAAYHRLARSPRARVVMQRLDHSMIYLLIAGTYVPLCLVAVPYSWGIPVLAAVVACAIVGIVLKLTAFHRARVLASALYPIMGWTAIVALPVLLDHLTWAQVALILAGGIAYTVGFPVLLVRRPDPWPRTFGYHEVWHVFTVVAATLHFAAVTTVVA
jgi:hemolysin III